MKIPEIKGDISWMNIAEVSYSLRCNAGLCIASTFISGHKFYMTKKLLKSKISNKKK